MPSCTIVRIICAQEGKHQKFWSVVPGGGLKLGSESEAQYFVCHSEQADLRSCLIQHLQSGAFIQQAPDRKLVLALSPASALPFSKLAAYSEGTLSFTGKGEQRPDATPEQKLLSGQLRLVR